MLLSPRKDGLTSLFKEVRVFKVCSPPTKQGMKPAKLGCFANICDCNPHMQESLHPRAPKFPKSLKKVKSVEEVPEHWF